MGTEVHSYDKAERFFHDISPNGPIFLSDRRFAWYFRGAGNSSHKLIPAALRPENKPELLELAYGASEFNAEVNNRVVVQVGAEVEVLWKFIEIADGSGLPIPGMSVEMMETFKNYRDNIQYLIPLLSG
ncbi:MAG: hypothetical protein L0228_19895 [Planctomycetes bacterium]|nr:hypothetical protein [Planctomycetota bacterium]